MGLDLKRRLEGNFFFNKKNRNMRRVFVFIQFKLKLFYFNPSSLRFFFHVTLVLEINISEKLFTYLEDFIKCILTPKMMSNCRTEQFKTMRNHVFYSNFATNSIPIRY